jgi:hypothetical protein
LAQRKRRIGTSACMRASENDVGIFADSGPDDGFVRGFFPNDVRVRLDTSFAQCPCVLLELTRALRHDRAAGAGEPIRVQQGSGREC